MAETALSNAAANALSGTTDSDTDAVYPTIGESTYYTTMYRMLQRMLEVEKLVNELRVYQDGALTFGVRAGRASHGTNVYSYAGATEQSLTDDTTNYIWLQVDSGALTLYVNTSAFPDPSATPHIPLATIATGTASALGSGDTYTHEDITDYRGRAIYELIG